MISTTFWSACKIFAGLVTFLSVTHWLDLSSARCRFSTQWSLSDCALIIVDPRIFLAALARVLVLYCQSVYPFKLFDTFSNWTFSWKPKWSLNNFNSIVPIAEYGPHHSPTAPWHSDSLFETRHLYYVQTASPCCIKQSLSFASLHQIWYPVL